MPRVKMSRADRNPWLAKMTYWLTLRILTTFDWLLPGYTFGEKDHVKHKETKIKPNIQNVHVEFINSKIQIQIFINPIMVPQGAVT
jgi:hypothetical protein